MVCTNLFIVLWFVVYYCHHLLFYHPFCLLNFDIYFITLTQNRAQILFQDILVEINKPHFSTCSA